MLVKSEQRERDCVFGRFVRREDGNMIVLGLFFFTLMVMMGGLAVDMMRLEARRTQLQQTADRAVLAAASVSQKLDASDVVKDYFLKAGLSEKLKSVDVVELSGTKSVRVTAASEIQPFFMHMMGIKELTAPAASTAMERIGDLEISMVLDVSGSMLTNDKIGKLRTAAKEFVDTIFASSDKNRTTISIIPYNIQVNLGDTVSSVFNMPRNHTRSFCVDFQASDFSSTTVSQTALLTQTGAVDVASSALKVNPAPVSGANADPGAYACPPQLELAVIPMTNDAAYLKNRIDALTASSNTSIDLGMKWGVTFLDPDSQGIITSLIAKGAVDNRFAGRPLKPTEKDDVLKVVVLMTDGENTDQYALKPAYASGMSNIYLRTSDKRLAVYFDRPDTTLDYYMPNYDPGKTLNYGDASPFESRWKANPFDSTTGWVQLTWPEVWERTTLSFLSSRLYGEALGLTLETVRDMITTKWGKAPKDARLSSICTAAKDKGIIVFGIGFADSDGTPVTGKPQILDCATSEAYYYDVSGVNISTAFRSIAKQITTLRLTQ